LTVSASPSPIAGDLCGSHCGTLPGEREALTALTIREAAGVGVNLTGGSQELRDNGTGAVIAMSTFVPSDFVRDAGTARVAASGQLVYHAGAHYPAAHAGAAATFTFVIQGTDDNGHAVTVTLTVPTTG
jgi:VCBS repeat-containing protein